MENYVLFIVPILVIVLGEGLSKYLKPRRDSITLKGHVKFINSFRGISRFELTDESGEKKTVSIPSSLVLGVADQEVLTLKGKKFIPKWGTESYQIESIEKREIDHLDI